MSAEDKAELRKHHDNLSRWLVGCSERDVLPEVRKLFAGLKKNPTDGIPDGAVYALYAEILCEQPLWVISRVVRDFLTGKIGDRKWAPSVADINQACLEKTARYRDEQLRVGSALGI